MDIRPIRTEQDYDAALARIDVLMDTEDEQKSRDELDVLVPLVKAYEAVHHPIGKQKRAPTTADPPRG